MSPDVIAVIGLCVSTLAMTVRTAYRMGIIAAKLDDMHGSIEKLETLPERVASIEARMTIRRIK